MFIFSFVHCNNESEENISSFLIYKRGEKMLLLVSRSNNCRAVGYTAAKCSNTIKIVCVCERE